MSYIDLPITGGGAGPTSPSLAGTKYVRSTRFQIINSGTSGTITLPPNSTVVLDDFGGTVDAVIVKTSSNLPTTQSTVTSAGTVIATSFDSSGNWSLTGTPTAYPIAIVYRVKQLLDDYDSLASDIWGVSTKESQKGYATIGITLDGGVTTGVKSYIKVPFNCSIVSWTLVGDIAGSCVIDIWKDTEANFPPTIADTITGANKPTITTSQLTSGSTTGWTTSVNENDILLFNVDSVSNFNRVQLFLKVTKDV
jgi:hypothetical protein